MKTKSKCTYNARPYVATLLTLALVFSIFAAMPLTASAANTNVTVLETDSIESLQAEIQAAINASSSGDIVTVDGKKYDVNSSMNLNIKEGVTVVWKASYSGMISTTLINLASGSGTFDVADGYVMNNGTGHAIDIIADHLTLMVSGGDVSAPACGIGVNASDSKVIINDGFVSAASGIAIATNGSNNSVIISGGIVMATYQAAVDIKGANSTVTVDGGFVAAYGKDVTGEGNVINMANSSTPTIEGSAVVCAWDRPNDPIYDEGSSTDLTILPTGAFAVWGRSGAENGIKYGSNGFLLVSGVTFNAAVFASPMENFMLQRAYKPGMFSDVVESMWYGFNGDKSVANAYEYELMSGSSATTFNPAGNITIAEAITVATRVHSFYTTGHQVEFTPIPGAKWYQGNVNYAIEKGIITAADFSDYGLAATRAQMAFIFSRSLPAVEFGTINTVNSLPDVNSGTPYYSAILMMYKAGVVGGDDGTGAFRPSDSVSRAEAAAIITRVILPASRLSDRMYG